MEPDITHFFGDGLYAKEARIPAGMLLQKHQHTFTHFSILARGKVGVVVDGAETKFYEAPACVVIKANVLHEIYAVENSTWYCVHATDEKDEDKIDEVLILKDL